MEFIELRKFINSNINPERTDYLYEHSIAGYPLYKDADFTNMYFVSNVISGYEVEVTGYTSGIVKIFDLAKLNGNWWYCNVPPFVKKQLFGN